MAGTPLPQVTAQPCPWPHDADLRPENTALLAIDMQTDFCGKGGYVDAMGYDLCMTRAPIEPLRALLRGLRARGVHVLHTREGHRPSLADCPVNKRWRSRQIGAGIGDKGPCGRVLVRGEPGWELVEELRPMEGEPVVDKPGKGSFVATDLDLVLRQRGVRHLALAGITTDVCVSTTLREAVDLGYDCLLLSDCTGATDYGNHLATLKTVQLRGGALGCVAAAADLLRAVGAEVPCELERGLTMVDLGHGIRARMPPPLAGLWMPRSLADVEVAPAAASDGRVAADPYAWPFDGDLRPENTALLAIDFQQGPLTTAEPPVLVAAARLMAAMRARRFHVLHTREGHARDLSDCSARKASRALLRGDPEHEIAPEVAPLEGEAVVDKAAYGAFSLTPLEPMLRGHGVRNLVLMGPCVDLAVHTTMRQANDRGFECLLVSDCVASVAEDVRLSALKQVKMQYGVFGAVASSEALLAGLEPFPVEQGREEPAAKKLKA